MQLELDKIRRDGGTQPRAALREEVVDEYAELMRCGTQFPPVTVFFDGHDYWLADGFHRVHAALKLDPHGKIEVDVVQGMVADAQWFSFGVNKTHGLRRTTADKQRVVRAALAHQHAQALSNRQLAEHCGVDEKTVRSYREQLGATAEIPQSTSGALEGPKRRLRTGRDGRTIDTKRIGKTRKKQKSGISRRAFPLLRGHSPHCPMIPLQFSPNNAQTAAATLVREFSREWVQSLVQELTEYLSTTGDVA